VTRHGFIVSPSGAPPSGQDVKNDTFAVPQSPARTLKKRQRSSSPPHSRKVLTPISFSYFSLNVFIYVDSKSN
jgi:hypothetical protein